MGYYDDYLEHHGILGQKWGVRRYQNADGSLTAKGKAHLNDVATSKIKSKIDTKNARMVYKNNAKAASSYAIAESRKAVKFEKKAAKYAKGTDKNAEYLNKSKASAKRSKTLSLLAEEATKKVRDIDEGKIKAGYDFMVQRDLNFHITKIAAYMSVANAAAKPELGKTKVVNPWLGTNEYKVIETNKKR